jgi:YidC/Oxa1 family membrane protein insertase
MNMRLLIAVIISLLLMIFYQYFFIKKPPQGTPTSKEEVVAKKEEAKARVAEELPLAGSGQRRLREGVVYHDVLVDTPLYKATFTTYGGRLKSWRLKGYKDKVPLDPVGKFVQNLVGEVFGHKGAQETPPQLVDMVTTTRVEDAPLGIAFTEGKMGYDEGIPYTPSSEGMTLTRTGGTKTFTFRWKSPRGGEIEKRFTFYADSYRMDMELVVSNPVNRGAVDDTLALEWAEEIGASSRYSFFGPIYYANGDFKQIKPKKIHAEGMVIQQVDWFGMEQNYFLALVYPATQGTSLVLRRNPEDIIQGDQLTPLALNPGGKKRISYTLYLGPKEADLLAQITPTAKKAASYGWFTFLAVPILKILDLTHTFTGNYGLDIIILAVFLKIIFTPLTHKSQQSMKEMQKLQPEVKRLQQKYKDDKQALNREVMEMYKRRKVNPLGGCLPMLIQLPVFFALYRAFYGAIELRHSPFVLWIKDLADKDPTYITPLLMGVTMFVQQKMTTVSADPAQAKMMAFMPIFFTFIFLSFPSGLVLYWLVTNVLAIGHQFYINSKQ